MNVSYKVNYYCAVTQMIWCHLQTENSPSRKYIRKKINLIDFFLIFNCKYEKYLPEIIQEIYSILFIGTHQLNTSLKFNLRKFNATWLLIQIKGVYWKLTVLGFLSSNSLAKYKIISQLSIRIYFLYKETK